MAEGFGGFTRAPHPKHRERREEPRQQILTERQFQHNLALIYTQLEVSQAEQRIFAKQTNQQVYEFLRTRQRTLMRTHHTDLNPQNARRATDINHALQLWKDMMLLNKYKIIRYQPQVVQVQAGRAYPYQSQKGFDDFGLVDIASRILNLGRKKK